MSKAISPQENRNKEGMKLKIFGSHRRYQPLAPAHTCLALGKVEGGVGMLGLVEVVNKGKT